MIIPNFDWKRVDNEEPPLGEWLLVWDGEIFEVLMCNHIPRAPWKEHPHYSWVDRDEEPRPMSGDDYWCYLYKPKLDQMTVADLWAAVDDEYDRIHDERYDNA